MRLSELMEAIPNRPRNFDLFVRNRIREINGLLAKLEEANRLIDQHHADGGSMLVQWLRYHDPDAAADVDGLDYLARRLEWKLPLESLRDNLDSTRKFGTDFLRYIFDAFDRADSISDRERSALAALDFAEEGAAQYGYDPKEPQYLDDEYYAAMGLLKGLLLLREVIEQGEKLAKYVLQKLAPIRDLKAASYTGKYRPDHQEVETLYHATAYADEIVRSGFKAEKPIGWRGLGNFGEQRGISFTHDLVVARNVMRALKEMALIARGELTSKQILGWIAKEKIDPKRIQQAFGHGKKIDAHMSVQDTAYLYRYYLAFSEHRTDPVFTYPEEMIKVLKDRSIRDIGVIAAEVRLMPEDEYLVGESEFRVPPDRVQSIRRVM